MKGLRSIAAACAAVAFAAAAGCGDRSVPEMAREIDLPRIPLLTRDDPPRLGSPREVLLMPGEETTVLVVLNRRGNTGPIKAEVKNLPAGITATVDPVVEVDDTAKITLKVAADTTLGDAPLDGRASVEATVNDRFVKRDLRVLVPQVARVAIPSLPPLVIQPGTTTIWYVPIERHGFDGPIAITATSSSGALDVQASAVPAGESVLKLRVTTSLDAADGEVTCSLEWTSYGRPLKATLSVAIVRHPFSLPAVVPVTLQRGDNREVMLGVSRTRHEGPISLAIDSLPVGTHASPPGVTLEAEPVAVVFRAEESAREGVAVVPLRAASGHLMAKGLVTVRVVGETGRKSLPNALEASLPDRFRPGGVDARRSPEARRALAEMYGTTEACGRTVRKALGWLASAQDANGGWQAAAVEGAAEARDPVAVAASAVLPFLAEGIAGSKAEAEMSATEQYSGVVGNALAFLESSQPTQGEKAGAIGSVMESHVLGLVALSEACALTADKALRVRAKLAVDRLTAFQGKKGDWSVPGGDPARDTAWAVLALHAARACGVGVPTNALRKATNWLGNRSTGEALSGSSPASAAGLAAEAEIRAACLLALACVDREGDSPAMVAGCSSLVGKAPEVGAERTECSPVFLLVAGDVLRFIEGEGYDSWNAAVRSFLTSNQVQEGPLAGSWDPAIFGGNADRVWATACATLCLQSHFRYLPLSRTARQDP